MADKRERIDVTVELEDELSRPARTAAGSIDELSDEVDELSASSAAATTQTNRLERALAALRRASGSAARDVDTQDRATKRWTASSKAASKETAKLGDRSKRASVLMAQLGKVMKLIKFPAIAAAITLAAAAVSSLGAAAFAAVAGLAPLVGTLGAIPALVLALASAGVAVKLGFKGVGEALKVVTDGTKGTAEHAAAMRKLTPAGQEFVGVLKEMKSETAGWGRAIQSAMLPGFSNALRGLDPILSTVKDGLRGAGAEMGFLAEQVGAVLGGSKDDLRTIFSQSNRILRNGLTPALTAFTGIFLDFAVAGGPLAERFATWLGLASERMAQLVYQGRQSGGLTEFLNRAGDLAADVGSVLGDMSVALFNIGREAGDLAGYFGGGLQTMMSDWRAWTETIEGQNAIREWFADARPLMEALGDTVGILAKSFMDLAANGDLTALVSQINTQLLPAMSDFAEGAAANLGPALVSLATAFIDFQAALSWSPLATILLGVATAANAVLDVFNLLPGPVKAVIAGLIILRTVAKLASGAMGLIAGPSVAGKQAGVFRQMWAGVQLYTDGLKGIPRAKGAVVGALQGMQGAGKSLMGMMGGPWGLAIAGATLVLGQWMAKQQEAKARVEELTATLDQQTAAITESTRASAIDMLEKEGALKAAQLLGISLDDVTDATLGNADAMKRIQDRYAELNSGDIDTAQFNAMKTLGAVTSDVSESLNTSVAAQKRKIEADQGAKVMTDELADSLRRKVEADRVAAGGSRWAADAARDQGDAIKYTIDRIKELRNLQMEAISAEIAYQQAKDDTAAALNEGKRTLDINTQAGRDNVNSIKDLIGAAAGLKNEAKRQAALKEAAGQIRRWGEESNISKDRIDNLIKRMIRTKEVATELDGTVIDFTVNANTDAAYAALAAFRKSAEGAGFIGPVSPQVLMDYVPGQQDGRNREHGGPVDSGYSYIVGEAGPEVFVGRSGASQVIGGNGQEQRTFGEPGVVLPNDFYEALPQAAPAPVPAMAGGGGDEPVPDIHNHFHGDGSQLTEADIERATLRAWQKFDRQRKERR